MENDLPQRKQIRLREYDYSQEGYYFITICTKNRERILSEIVRAHDCARIKLNNVGVDAHIDPKKSKIQINLLKPGEIVQKYIKNYNDNFDNIKITGYVIMPDHVHLIININENVIENGSPRTSTPTLQNATLPFIISTLKRFVNKEIAYSIWQRNYYEHIIRNEKEYYKIIEYMKYNPIKWLNEGKINE